MKSIKSKNLKILNRGKRKVSGKIDKDEQIQTLIRSLEEGNKAPVLNYLKSKLSKPIKEDFTPTNKAEVCKLELIKNSTSSEKLIK